MCITRKTGKTGFGLALIMTLGLGVSHSSLAQVQVVSPGGQATTEGNGNNNFPFNSAGSQRYQQVYNASDFSAFTGPTEITGIAFRPDGLIGAAFSTTLPDIQIDLSTTSRSANNLSTVLASNIGSDDTVVFGRGPLSLSSSDTGPTGGPKAFDIQIVFAHPFLYAPSLGNLLLDVRNFGGGATTQFDSENSAESVSRVFSDLNSSSGSEDTTGLVTRFDASPVPETTTTVFFGLLLALGVGGIVIAAKRGAKTDIS